MTNTLSLNVREPDGLGRKNITRRTRSLPRKFLREGKVHWLALHWLLMQSDLGREGIENSGSYKFADHIYRNQPSGRNWLGKLVDALLLRMPATRAFRRRYRHAQDAIRTTAARHAGNIRVLAVPCGIPRDVMELPSDLLSGIEYLGMDLDPDVLRLAAGAFPGGHFVEGDALKISAYPPGEFDLVISTGLGEFLSDDELLTLYKNVHAKLRPGGVFCTSATAFEPRSEALLNAFELRTHYRNSGQLAERLGSLPWSSVHLTVHESGLQTFALARK